MFNILKQDFTAEGLVISWSAEQSELNKNKSWWSNKETFIEAQFENNNNKRQSYVRLCRDLTQNVHNVLVG